MTNLPVTKNETLTVDIIDLSHEGLGVAKVDGYPLFIENTLPGEQAEVLVLKVGKKFGFAKVVTLVTESKDRVSDVNETLIRTGIAPLHHMTYEAQLAFKEQQVKNVFQRIAKMPEVKIHPILGMENPLAYRNKAQVPVRKVEGQLSTGFFRKNSHDLVPLENYYIQDEKIDEAIIVVRDVLEKYGVKAYIEAENNGNLRHIIVRRGHYSKQMMIVLVTRTPKLFNYEKMVQEIHQQLPEVVSIVQNINPDATNVILGKTNKTLFGQNYITDELLGKEYRISAQSFYQVNSVQAETLYRKAIEFAGLRSSDTVIDAYCGIGTIGLSLADKVKHVYGLEINPDAISDAKINAKMNGLSNVTFEIGKAEYIMPTWLEKGVQADVLIVDPPRKGLAESFIKTAVEMAPKKVIYVSCNPASLARDCQLFAESGYEVRQVQPVDMFPQTPHVEAVVELVKVK
ncbi:23S rRNA (uracil(1939)-C(5))-methyltransferase RlmD [Vagococcus intermedius]|uniref:23S rRNA (Uracil(1939)-C(5))-methyltransferase RlmD n=1 Tax=Vagococcus intermedius TaxID=2991418 RepID=A0AAF0I6Z4_9ENTE|nr:23S rRNA (uracil(1939)-C(5))-methyltransferase RlmD [Vagococcus intermedius]WEG73004.1 23S rRNA (uracil(1939)-C(5))-methyltransferase RlmD [Vagococcus intermedius]WEG75090.1 23S rRNA (uracil(1939)-C(5))-methyltransferase RlmD [Vagococcus intermedius]